MKLSQITPAILILFGGSFYVFFRFYNLFPSNFWTKFGIWTLGFLLTCCFFVGMFAALSPYLFSKSFTEITYKIGTSWLIILLYLSLFFIAFDILKVLQFFPFKPIVFQVVKYSIFGGLFALFFLFIFANYKYHNKAKIGLQLSTNKEIENLKIVAMSDLHIGYSIGKNELEKWIQLINAEKPDIVLFAGDVIDNSITPLITNNIAETFRKIESKYGVFACLGNHEYIAGLANVSSFFRDANITLVCDSTVLVNKQVYIIGRDDKTNPNRKSTKVLMEGLDNTKFTILLDHQPYHLSESEENKIDFQFSGHTHAGQVFPISWITNKIYENHYGYLKKGNTQYFVSSGVGIWGGKFRIGSQSEYLVINLTKNKLD
ncbi:MAG: metallophosphoesterase [Bacteroidales bacterium]